jgi:hypothetical protein
MDSALNLTVERTRPISLSLTGGEAREETANRRADDRRGAADLRKDDLASGPLGKQATLNRIAAADERLRCLKRGLAEPKQSRAASEQPQLKRPIPLSWPDEAPSDPLNLSPIGET